MNRTDIEYLDYTLNPLAMRCTPVSDGCTRCWHIRMAKRMAGNPRFPDEVRAAYAGDHEPILIEDRLEEPLRLRKPSRIGVQFMGDLFHKAVDYSTVVRIWDMMKETPQHTYMILTKRAKRQADATQALQMSRGILPNVWLGVTVENQAHYGRIEHLRASPAAGRFVSVEPMLGPLEFDRVDLCYRAIPGVAWIICGAETGPGARTMQLSWAYDVKRQCEEAGVPFFFKSAGKNIAIPDDLLVREWPGGAG